MNDKRCLFIKRMTGAGQFVLIKLNKLIVNLNKPKEIFQLLEKGFQFLSRMSAKNNKNGKNESCSLNKTN